MSMSSVRLPQRLGPLGRTKHDGSSDRAYVAVFVAAGSIAITVVMVLSRQHEGLGLSPIWAWVLTGLQVAALIAVGRNIGAGWLVGAGAQECWITYALITEQHGFIPGCAVSLVVQIHSYLRPPKFRQPRV